MAKYDYNLKLEIVKYCLNGDRRYNLITKIYEIPNKAQVQG